MCEETNTEDQTERRVMRDLDRRPRSRKHREIVLRSGERVKRTDIGWTEEEENE
ncbi:MAG: hypothetical protein Q6364_13220 [Candidatus Hermodarchaeota archaeon]|nr:hypothetical protein [Candidatus Hermodarchaeota archaeon]